ncbi:MAG: flagellar hook-basal body complex protein, partial [Desulfovibrionaceae bacterium]|nr:flagellar hook-basal body complex protein [Desulfovibrionaceae bacterium]
MIGVSTAMWASVSGLQVYGTQLGNIGTNIANSGSIGYRSTTAYAAGGFAGHLSTLSGASTIAQGASVSTVYTNHANGIGINSASSTHLAITGGGLFGVRNSNSEEILYTRRGDFEFKNDGYLSTSEGYRVQGWAIPENEVTIGTVGTTGAASRLKGSGVPGDIALPGDTSPPKHTTFVEIINNLGASSSPGNSTNDDFPYASLMTTWNGQANPPLGEGTYMYQSTIKVFDEGGSPHEITVYFDKVDTSNMTGNTPGEHWEFIVTMSPSEDKRQFGGEKMSGTESAGLLMTGTLAFSSAGSLENMTAFVPKADVKASELKVYGAKNVNGSTQKENLQYWVAAPQSTNGLPIFFPNFSGSDSVAANGASNATIPENAIELNLGIRAGSIGFQGYTSVE